MRASPLYVLFHVFPRAIFTFNVKISSSDLARYVERKMRIEINRLMVVVAANDKVWKSEENR